MMTTINDQDLYDAETRMSLTDALAACGAKLSDLAGLDEECTLHDSRGATIVSYWPTTNGDVEARWHRREECDDMNGDITCEDGDAVPHAYYSRLDGDCIPEPEIEPYEVEAEWLDEHTGERADHADLSRGYYEATLPSGARITSADRYCPGMIGDVWHEDDGLGGADDADSPEFRAATIKLIGGPRNGETVS